MLKKHRTTVSLTEGSDTGDLDPKVPGTTLVKAENAVFPRRGAVGRRNGYSALTAPANVQNNLVDFNGKPILFGDRVMVRDDDSETSGGWAEGDEIMITDAEVQDTTNAGSVGVYSCDVAIDTTNDLRCVVEERSDSSRHITVTHRTTGVVLDTASVSGAGAIRCVARGNGEIVIWYVNGSSQLRYRTVSSAGVISSGTTAASSIDNLTLGVCVIGNDVFVTYLITALTQCYVGKLTAAASFSSAAYHGGLTVGGVVGLGVINSDDLALLVTNTAGGVQYLYARFCDTSLTMHAVAQTIDSDNSATYSYTHPVVCQGSVGGDAQIYWQRNDVSSTPSDRVVFECLVALADTASPSVGTPAAGLANVEIASQPFIDSLNNNYLCVFGPNRFDDGLDAAYFLVRGAGGSDPFLPVGRALTNRGMSTDGGRSITTSWVQDLGSSQYGMGLPAYTNNDHSGGKYVKWTMGGTYANASSTTLKGRADTLDDVLLIAGSMPYAWDGETATEIGFLCRPKVDAVVTLTTGYYLDAGDYGYVAVYEWIDSLGRVHQSAPSDVDTITADGADYATIEIRTLPVTRKGTVYCVVYRTTADGNVYYRVGQVANDVTANTVSFTDDSMHDSNTASTTEVLIAQEQLYTSRGLVENVAPPNTRVTAIHQRRHFAVNREREATEIRYSKRYEPGTGLEHSDSLVVNCDPRGGNITALASLHDKLLIFKADRVLATTGPGLNADAATGLAYSEPYIVSTDVGALDCHGVAETPVGVVFLSSKGIYLIDRALRITPIGRQVRYFTDGYDGSVVTANAVPDKSIIIWQPDAGATRTESVVWNYEQNMWSHWTSHDALGACVSNGRLTWTDGVDVFVSTAAYADPSSTPITLTLETRWIPIGEFGQDGRVYEVQILGQPVAQSRISAQGQYSYDAVWDTAQNHDIASGDTWSHDEYYGAGLAAGYADDALLLDFDPSRQRCTAFRLRVKCDGGSQASLTTQGAEFSAVSMLLGLRGPTRRGEGAKEMS